MRTVTALALAAVALASPVQVAGAVASEVRPFVYNGHGGVNRCEPHPLRTRAEVAYCAGGGTSASDPRRFDCRRKEVDAEFEWCALSRTP